MGIGARATILFERFSLSRPRTTIRFERALFSMPRTMIPLEKTASILNGNYKIRLEPVKKCGDVAWSLGYKIFALQDGGQCFGTSSLEEYKNYGTSDACLDDGKGGPLANAVYMIRTGIRDD